MTDSFHVEHVLEPLRVALRLEEEGRKFFADCATRVQGKVARKTFAFLADEEVRHIERIKQFYASLESSGVPNDADVPVANPEQRLREFNDWLAGLREEVGPALSDVDAYQTALRFENGAEEFYARQARESEHPLVQKFYRWLIHEEEMHARVINSCLKFAQDPAAWFQARKG